jgi:hypothetical protein
MSVGSFIGVIVLVLALVVVSFDSVLEQAGSTLQPMLGSTVGEPEAPAPDNTSKIDPTGVLVIRDEVQEADIADGKIDDGKEAFIVNGQQFDTTVTDPNAEIETTRPYDDALLAGDDGRTVQGSRRLTTERRTSVSCLELLGVAPTLDALFLLEGDELTRALNGWRACRIGRIDDLAAAPRWRRDRDDAYDSMTTRGAQDLVTIATLTDIAQINLYRQLLPKGE